MKARLLIVTQDFPPEKGGIQTYAYELAKALIAMGVEVAVIAPGNAKNSSILPEARYVKRIAIHSSWLFLSLIFRLPGLIKKEGWTHILYLQWQAALPELIMRKKKHSVMVIVHGRELLTSVLGPFSKPLRQAVFAHANHILPNSHAVSDLLLTTSSPSPSKITLCHPGVDAQRFTPVDARFLRERYGLQNKPIILSLTRMVARKNLAALIDAMPLVHRSIPNAVLVLCGGGPEYDSLKAQSLTLGLSDSVFFPGRIAETEMAAHYCLGDVFALPALQPEGDIEGFGIVFLEAAAYGIAVLAGRSGGIPDAVKDGETGILVNPKRLEEIANGLIALLGNPLRLKEMGHAGRQRVLSQFTWKHTAETILQLIH